MVINSEQAEKIFLLLYTLTKYQLAKESRSPVAGITILNAQKPFSSPEGDAASAFKRSSAIMLRLLLI